MAMIVGVKAKQEVGFNKKTGRIFYDHSSGNMVYQGWKRYEEAEEEE